MQVFRNKQTHKQTTQAIVIVLLNDASLRRLWKRANPEKVLRLGTKLEVCPHFCWFVGSLLGPWPQSQMSRNDLLCICWRDLQGWRSKEHEPPGYSFPRCGPDSEPSRGEKAAACRETEHLSLGVHSWNRLLFFFVVSSFCKKPWW